MEYYFVCDAKDLKYANLVICCFYRPQVGMKTVRKAGYI